MTLKLLDLNKEGVLVKEECELGHFRVTRGQIVVHVGSEVKGEDRAWEEIWELNGTD